LRRGPEIELGGNQLAVLPDAAGISTEGMQRIAKRPLSCRSTILDRRRRPQFNNPSSSKEEKLPLVRIDLLEGKSERYRAQVGDILYQTMVEVLNVPEHDRFQVITEHTKASLPFDREYLGIHRSDDCIFFQITLNSGRSIELKQRFYTALADHLHEGVKIRKEDVLINLVEVPKENWSFGNGEAQYVTPPR
jgi:4-oxalocrotonate tautomerase